MEVDVIGRIRPSLRGEGPHSLHISNSNRISSHIGGVSHSFSVLYKQDANNYEIYKKSVEPLLDLFVAGFNSCLIMFGESNSGKSYTLAGESVNKSGIVPILLDSLFSRVAEERRRDSHQHQQTSQRSGVQVSLSMLEIYNENVRDMLQLPKVQADFLEVVETAEDGLHVRDQKWVYANSASEATRAFRDGWSRRTQVLTDFGPAHNYASIVFIIELSLVTGENPAPNRSRFVLVDMPAAEKLAEDPSQLRMREGPTLNKQLFAFSRLVANLANSPHPDRTVDYNESRLTQLLREEIGGNCKTRMILNMRPHTDPTVLSVLLRTSSQVSNVKNFPIMNDNFAQGLVTQYRARILSLQNEMGVSPNNTGSDTNPFVSDMKEESKRLRTENVSLRDKNEQMYLKLEALQNRLGDLAAAKRDLSSNFMMSEEEKLKVSKALVDLQIDNNKLMEDGEQTKFELTNKVLLLENRVMEAEMEKEKHVKVSRESKDRLKDLEGNRKQLADEYVVLKSNYMALAKDFDKEVAKNEELAIELLNMVNAKEMMYRQRETLDKAHDTYDLALSELERIRHLISRLSSNRNQRMEDFLSEEDRIKLEKVILGDTNRFRDQVDSIKKMYSDDQKNLEHRLQQLHRDLTEARTVARQTQKKVAEQATELYGLRSNTKELEQDNNKLQNKLKELNNEYRNRLVRYVEDIAEYVDSSRNQDEKNLKLKSYMEAMLKDIKKANRTREEQLSTAVKKYRDLSKTVAKKHEQLLIAYRILRDQMASGNGVGDILGDTLPPEDYDLSVDDHELQLYQNKEIQRLNNLLKDAQGRLSQMKDETMKAGRMSQMDRYPTMIDKPNIGEIRDQLRDITRKAQLEIETEKAQLMARASMAEEQLSETQDYIDKHLARYRQEILRLRRLLNARGHEVSDSPEFYPIRHKHRREPKHKHRHTASPRY